MRKKLYYFDGGIFRLDEFPHSLFDVIFFVHCLCACVVRFEMNVVMYTDFGRKSAFIR